NLTRYPIERRAQTLFAFPQRFFRTNDRRRICACTAIAAEFSLGIKYGLATRLHVYRGAVATGGEIYEVAKRLPHIHRGPDSPPLLRFRFKIEGAIPGSSAKSGGRAGSERIPAQHRQFVVRPRFPKPIRRRFGIVAEPLFALAQRVLGALA